MVQEEEYNRRDSPVLYAENEQRTVWYCKIHKGRMKPGEHILSGGLGSIPTAATHAERKPLRVTDFEGGPWISVI